MEKPTIIFKDENFAVINKPSGMIVNNADTSKDEYTLQDYILENFNLEGDKLSEFMNRGGIVHRLDKQTSGVIIIALNEKSFVFLQNQFKSRQVKKEYIALCHGQMVGEGEVNVPVGRLPWNRMRFGVIPHGKEAFTRFSLLNIYYLKEGKEYLPLSLVRAYPTTGRTHQIRVHLQYINHPIFSDPLYGGRKRYSKDRRYLDRHFLHAAKITFISPTTNEQVTFEAPLGDELSEFLSTLSNSK